MNCTRHSLLRMSSATVVLALLGAGAVGCGSPEDDDTTTAENPGAVNEQVETLQQHLSFETDGSCPADRKVHNGRYYITNPWCLVSYEAGGGCPGGLAGACFGVYSAAQAAAFCKKNGGTSWSYSACKNVFRCNATARITRC